jgi:hypothetical protein
MAVWVMAVKAVRIFVTSNEVLQVVKQISIGQDLIQCTKALTEVLLACQMA